MIGANSSRRRIRAIWLVLSLGLAVVIAGLTLMPPALVPKGPHGIDKLYHASAFAALVFPTAFLRPRLLRAVAPLALLYGGAIEIVQPLVGRTADISDLVADGVGILIGVGLGLVAQWVLLVRRGRQA